MLYLDSGTLTPLLQKLERRGLITRQRAGGDGRNRLLTLTEEGLALLERTTDIPGRILERMPLDQTETDEMQSYLRRILCSVTPLPNEKEQEPHDHVRRRRRRPTLPDRR